MRSRIVCTALLLVATTAVWVPGSAVAHPDRASVRVVHGVLRFRGTDGEDRVLFGTRSSNGPTSALLISAHKVRTGANCVHVSSGSGSGTFGAYPYRVKCSLVRSTRWVLLGGDDQIFPSRVLPGPYYRSSVPNVMRGGAGADEMSGGYGHDLLNGGPGNDEIIGGAGSDALFGGTGDDTVRVSFQLSKQVGVPGETLHGGRGDDAVYGGRGKGLVLGGPGNDQLSGGLSSDRLVGGPGADEMTGGGSAGDVIDYTHRSVDISVTDDGVANDGALGEGDNVLPIGQFGQLTGTEVIETGSGNDTISMTGYRARLIGDSGNDDITLHGGPGALFGGGGEDALAISGAPGRLRGGTGDDHLSSSDNSVDHDGCGPGTDDVTGDASDAVASNCEVVTTT
jgi:Ca2+-binding RTX toxin-like protein